MNKKVEFPLMFFVFLFMFCLFVFVSASLLKIIIEVSRRLSLLVAFLVVLAASIGISHIIYKNQ